MRYLRVNGELAEVIPVSLTRAKLVYLVCEPQDGLPTELHYHGPDRFLDGWIKFSREDDPTVLLVERIQPPSWTAPISDSLNVSC